MRWIKVIVLALVTCAAGASKASAAFIYNNVADTTTTAPGYGAFTSFGTTPSVSGSNVAFVGLYSGGHGIYTGSAGATGAAKIVDSGDTAPGHGAFTFFTGPSVSGSNVAFAGGYSGGNGIYTGSVGTTGVAKVVDTTDAPLGHGAFNTFGSASVSGSNIAFFATHDNFSGRGIYTGSVGATGAAKIVDTGDTAPGHGPFTGFGTAPSVSGSNLAFVGNYDSSGQGIYTGTVGAGGAAKVVDTDDTAPGHGAFTFFADSLSVSGSNVAFVGNYSGGQGIYSGTVGATGAAKVVETGDTAPGHGAFTGFDAPSLSGSNLAFLGAYSGGHGIYLASGGAGGSLSAVLNTGDTLFGGTVSSVSLGSFAHDNDAIAFRYTLADGRSGIGVATVPEPASLSLLALAGVGLLRRRRTSR